MIHESFSVEMKSGVLHLGAEPLIMGILNATPDSFSDGGDHNGTEAAITHAQLMIAQGVDIIDLGGESTRPGSDEVNAQAELDRVIPVLDALAEIQITTPISIDTYKAIVADQALQAGAQIINDVWGFQRDPDMAAVAAHHNAPSILMHWDTQRDTSKDLISEMKRWLEVSVELALRAGLSRDKIILDPGFGFAKSLDDNYELLGRIGEFSDWHLPILIGTSRKRMIGELLNVQPKERVSGTVSTSVLTYMQGGHIFRVHDVRENADALKVAHAMVYGISKSETK